jgi:hypothetical protein
LTSTTFFAFEFYQILMAPPPAAGSRRPSDSAFKQQKLKAWQPILTPKWVIGCFTVVGAIFIPIGVAISLASRDVRIYSFEIF